MISYRVDTSSRFYIDNWIMTLNMYCMPKSYIGIIGAMAFGGVFLSCFLVPQLGDKYGRKIGWVVTVCTQLPLYIMANCTDNIGVIYVGCWFLGMGLIGRFTFGFVMLTELTPNKRQAVVGTLFCALDAAATLYITLFIS